MAERARVSSTGISEEMLTEAPAAAAILENWEERAEQELEVRQIQSALPKIDTAALL